MNPRTFFTEIKRRRVYTVAVAYVVVAWLIIQVATQVFPFFDIPHWALGWSSCSRSSVFPSPWFVSWAFEMTPKEIKLEGESARLVRRQGLSFQSVACSAKSVRCSAQL